MQELNSFSIISRLFGNLLFRSPEDPILAPVFSWLQQGQLEAIWALETDEQSRKALSDLAAPLQPKLLQGEYERLFHQPLVDSRLSSYGIDVEVFVQFRVERGLPDLDKPDHFALLLLTASWIEDNLTSVEAQRILFETFLLPAASAFLSQLESKANLPFYRSLAQLCREILSAMADELEESGDSEASMGML